MMNSTEKFPSNPTHKIKAALLLPGVITDQSWNTVGYEGLMAAKNELDVEVAYTESIQPSLFEAAFRSYAKEGCDLIIGFGSEFGEAALAVAQEFRETKFAVMNSNICGENLAGLDTKNTEMGYIAGYTAALISKSKVVAFVGATPIVAMARAEHGFKLGVKAANLDCKSVTKYIGSFDNIPEGRQVGEWLVQQENVDVIFNNDDEAGIGTMLAAEELGILAIGSDYDQKSIAPKAIVTSILAKVTPMILSIIREVKNGTFTPNLVRMYGFETGTYDLVPLDRTMVTASQAEKIYAIRDQLKAGEISLPHLTAAPR